MDLIGGLTGNEWADLSYYIDGQYMAWVPIYDSTSGNGSNTAYHIVGFGAIVITDSGDGRPHAKWLRGKAISAPCIYPGDGKDYTIEGKPYCAAPGGAHIVDVTGAVRLVR